MACQCMLFLHFMKLSHELSIDKSLINKGRLPPNIREFLPKDRGWDVVAQYTKKVLTFILIPANNEVLCVRLSKIRHIRNHAPYHGEGKRLGPITSALMKIVISKSQINARALMTNHAHILNNREGI